MEKQIKLDEKSAQEFVSAASRCNFDIDVFYNRIIIGVSNHDFEGAIKAIYDIFVTTQI